MNRLFKIFLASVGASALVACGGGSDDPVDMYVGTWRSACFPYVANNGNTYFARDTSSFTKASSTSLNATRSDTTAYSDSACNNVLAAISNGPNATIQLGPKASFLGAEVDTISMAFPTETHVGYMTANATQLFIIAEPPDVIPSGWGIGSPYTRMESKQASASTLTKTMESNDHLAPAKPLGAYFR
ncbi:hypothetical protein [Hydrogenophaga taeniospiralis]|nr:hypothetical protein [Hydrogenophaga taeniospiralis]